MLIYAYHPETGEFTRQDVADPSPLEEGVFLIPANATKTPPPAAEPGKVPVWKGKKWTLVEDHRGETWFGGDVGRTAVIVTSLGDPTTAGLRAEPAPPTDAENSTALVQYAASRRWDAETGGIAIEGGRIETDRTTQAMLTGAVLASQAKGGPKEFRWKGPAGFVTLSAAEVNAMAVAVSLHVQACFAVEADVVDAIASGACTTTEAIDAFPWPA